MWRSYELAHLPHPRIGGMGLLLRCYVVDTMIGLPLPYDPAHCSSITTIYDGPHKRPVPHDDGVWFKKMQTWHDRHNDSEVGSWRWARRGE